MKYNKLVKTLAIAMASIGLISNASAQEDCSYILATASTGGLTIQWASLWQH